MKNWLTGAMASRPNWGWGNNPPVPMFTEAEIREVMEKHHPYADHCCEAPKCSCGPQTVARTHCFYCAAPVPQDDHRATKHKKGCKVPASGFLDMGVSRGYTPDFTDDHLIEKLKEAHDRRTTAQLSG